MLSESTQAYDRGETFAAYRTISTLQEYVLVDQYRPHLERYEKQSDRQWLFAEYDGLAAAVKLSSVPARFAIGDLYEELLEG